MNSGYCGQSCRTALQQAGASLLWLPGFASAESESVVADTQYGKVRHLRGGDVCVFKSIPYAQVVKRLTPAVAPSRRAVRCYAQPSHVKRHLRQPRRNAILLFVATPALYTLASRELQARLQPMLGEHTDRVLSLYRKTRPTASAADLFFPISTEQMYGYTTTRIAERKAQQKRAPMVFDTTSKVVNDLHPEERRLWEELLRGG